MQEKRDILERVTRTDLRWGENDRKRRTLLDLNVPFTLKSGFVHVLCCGDFAATAYLILCSPRDARARDVVSSLGPVLNGNKRAQIGHCMLISVQFPLRDLDHLSIMLCKLGTITTRLTQRIRPGLDISRQSFVLRDRIASAREQRRALKVASRCGDAHLINIRANYIQRSCQSHLETFISNLMQPVVQPDWNCK